MRANVKRAPVTMPVEPGLEGHHTCRRCPVCGSEECAVLQDLGRYCDTALAAHEAALAERERQGSRRARNGVRGSRR